jgi:integrase
MTAAALIEPSFVDAARAIETANDLPVRTRSHWCCSLRRIAQAMDRPPELIPARWTAISAEVARLHPARVGSTPKTLANHKSNVRAALLWFGQVQHVPRIGAPLSPAWGLLRGRMADQHRRKRLSGLMRYCSARGIEPAAVDESVLNEYMRYRAETTQLATDDAARRGIARAWNAEVGGIKGEPSQRLHEPPIKPLTMPPWDSFPERLREEIEQYLSGLTKMRRGARGKRIRPCKESTIRTRRAELQAFARAAVRQGIPIESLSLLSALLDPILVEKVIDAYWREGGEEPRVYTIDLAWKLLSVARETKCLREPGLERLDDIRATLDDYRRGGLTEKNLKVIRQVLTEGIWDEVVKLPCAMMVRARLLRDQAPVKAAVIAQIATGIAILSFAPIRLGNLIQIRLDENLIRPGGLKSPYWLVFPGYDVKNRVQLEFPLDPALTAVIEEYIHDFRPMLLRGSKEPWLFPGETCGQKNARTFSLQVTQRIEKATGLRITVHQFRHAAAAILLKSRPGEYELVRRLLGHRNMQTTRNFYIGLENIQASEIFSKIVLERMGGTLEAAEGPAKGRHHRPTPLANP